MTPDYQQVLDLLANHFQQSAAAGPVNWDVAGWKAWLERMDALAPPAPSERLTGSDTISAAVADFDALLQIAASYESASDLTSAGEVYEFVRSTAERQLGPASRATEDAVAGIVRTSIDTSRGSRARLLERLLYTNHMEGVIAQNKSNFILLLNTAILRSGVKVGHRKIESSKRIRRVLLQHLDPQRAEFFAELNEELERELPFCNSAASHQASRRDAQVSTISFMTAATLAMKGLYPQYAQSLDTSRWRCMHWIAITLTLIRKHQMQDI